MRGRSSRSLEATLAAVDAAISDGADGDVLGDELFAIVSLLDAEPALRRLFTDPSTDVTAQVAFADKLLGQKVGAPALKAFEAAVNGRWTSSLDLPDALEIVGVSAHVARAEKDGSLDDLEDILFRFGRIISSSPDLRDTLTDRTTAVDRKQELVESLLNGKVGPSALALIKQATAARHHGVEQTLAEFSSLAAARRQRLVATVRATYVLDGEQKTRLVDALSRKYGHEVHVNLVVDPEIVGGIVVELGGEIIDGSMSGRLEDARRHIAG